MKIKPFSVVMIVALFCCLMSVQAFAGGIKDRMKQRLPAIVKLKAQGIVGENNRGYLGFVGSKQSGIDVLKAENKDRKLIYSKIAKQQGTTLQLVEERRAIKLSQRAKSGEFVQKPDGTWIKK